MTDNSTAALWRRRLDCTRQGLPGSQTAGQLVRAAAPPPFLRAVALYCTMRVRRTRLAGQQGTVPALLCGCSAFWSAVFSRRQRFDARRPSRTHSRATFEPFTLPDGVRPAGSTAHDSCCSSSCHHTDPGWTSAWRGWRSPADGAPNTTIMERRRRACASASRWVSRGTRAYEEAQSSTVPRLTLSHHRRLPAVLRRRSAHPPRAGA
jgi:hypothetical protein